MADSKVVQYLKQLQAERRAPQAFFQEQGLIDQPSQLLSTGIDAIEEIFGQKKSLAQDLQDASNFDYLSQSIIKNNLYDAEGNFQPNNIQATKEKIQSYYNNLVSENPNAIGVLNNSMLGISKTLTNLDIDAQSFTDAENWVNGMVAEMVPNKNYDSSKEETEYNGMNAKGLAIGNPIEVPGGIDSLEFDFMRIQDSDVMDWASKAPHLERITKILGKIENYNNTYGAKQWQTYPGGADLKNDLASMDKMLSTYVNRLMLADKNSGGMILTEFEQDAFDKYQKHGSTKQLMAVYQTSVNQFNESNQLISTSLQKDIEKFELHMNIFNSQTDDGAVAVARYVELYKKGEERSDEETLEMNNLQLKIYNPLHKDNQTLSDEIDYPVYQLHEEMISLNTRLQSNEITYQNINQGQRYFHTNQIGDTEKTGVDAIMRPWEYYDPSGNILDIMPKDDFKVLQDIFVNDKTVMPKAIVKKDPNTSSSNDLDVDFNKKDKDDIIDITGKTVPPAISTAKDTKGLTGTDLEDYNDVDTELQELYKQKNILKKEVTDKVSDATDEDITSHYDTDTQDGNKYTVINNQIDALEDKKIKTYTSGTSVDVSYADKGELEKTLALWNQEYEEKKKDGLTDAESVQDYYELSDGTNSYVDMENRVEKFDEYLPGEAIKGFSLKDDAKDIITNFIQTVPAAQSSIGDIVVDAKKEFFEANPNLDDQVIRNILGRHVWDKINKSRKEIEYERKQDSPNTNKIKQLQNNIQSQLDKAYVKLQEEIDIDEAQDLGSVSIKRNYGKTVPENLSAGIKEGVNSSIDDIINGYVYSLNRDIAVSKTNVVPFNNSNHNDTFFKNNPNLNKKLYKPNLVKVGNAKLKYEKNPTDKNKELYEKEYKSLTLLNDFVNGDFTEGGVGFPSKSTKEGVVLKDKNGDITNSYLETMNWDDDSSIKKSFLEAMLNIPYSEFVGMQSPTPFKMSEKEFKKFMNDFGLTSKAMKEHGRNFGPDFLGDNPIDGQIEEIWKSFVKSNKYQFTYENEGNEQARKYAKDTFSTAMSKLNKLFETPVFKLHMDEYEQSYLFKLELQNHEGELEAYRDEFNNNAGQGETMAMYYNRLKNEGNPSGNGYFRLVEIMNKKKKSIKK